MRGDWIKYLRPLGITLLILVVLEIFSTALLPMLGLTKYRIPFNVLLVLYLGFKSLLLVPLPEGLWFRGL